MDDDEGGQDFRARARAEGDALNAAIAAVEGSMSGQRVQDVEARLVGELRARSLFMSRGEIHLQALLISDPEWATRHPLSVEKLLAEMHSPESAREEAEFVAQLEQTQDRLGQIVDRMWRVRRATVSARRTVDGVMLEIQIDPWSQRRADKLRRAAAPSRVSVVPFQTQAPDRGA